MLGSAQGLIGFLEEDEVVFKVHGIKELLKIVTIEWPQISEDISLIEKLANDTEFEHYQLASSLASRTFYHMGKMGSAVRYALKAGPVFDPSAKDEYTKRIVSHAIQRYIKKAAQKEKPEEELEELVKEILTRLLREKKYGQCLVLAIETRFVEFIHEAMKANPELVTEAIKIAKVTVQDCEYRSQLLQNFVEFAKDHCDKVILSELHRALDDPTATGHLLIALKESSEIDNWLLAYQIAFDLSEDASQYFRSQIINMLPEEMSDLKDILMRKKLLDFYLDFLFRNCNKDMMQIITAMKEGQNMSYKLIHTSAILAYAFMYAGTGNDTFYRDNVQWFFNSQEPDWSEFITIASIGTIHNGRLGTAKNILQPYLKTGSPMYSLGGGLYALGLVYANYLWDESIVDILTGAIANTNSAVVKHGGCLGLGLVALGSHEERFYSQMCDVLNQDDPISGEAAAYGAGLVMLGRGPSDELDELLKITMSTPHDKVTRGGAMGLAFVMYGKEEQCEPLVSELLTSRVPLLRESAAWVTALAYVGTASNEALQRLLHLAISDVNTEVRRTAIIGIGFVLSKNPKEVPAMIDLLAKSHMPDVRSGAALALGIACAGTGMKDAIEILKPLLDDMNLFVKQSAIIGMAMVLQQQSDLQVPYCKEFRKILRKGISKKAGEISVWGINMAYGILNASGRNVIISCNTLGGENSTLSTIGLAMFCNYIYWHPLSLMITLAFHPTAIIGVDENLQIPEWSFFSEGKPGLYADPPSFDSEKEVVSLGEAKKLSISKKAEKKEESKPVEESPKPVEESPKPVEESPKPVEESSAPDATPAPEDLDFQQLPNVSRVTMTQIAGVNLQFDFAYQPITNKVHHGVVMLKREEEE